jgi:hypothetical protein
MDRSTYEQLLHEMYRKVRHDVQKCWRELLLEHARCHYHVSHESIAAVLTHLFLTDTLENSAHFYDRDAHLFVQ